MDEKWISSLRTSGLHSEAKHRFWGLKRQHVEVGSPISKQKAFSPCQGLLCPKRGQTRIGSSGGQSQCPELWAVGHRSPSGAALSGSAGEVIAEGAPRKRRKSTHRGTSTAQRCQGRRKGLEEVVGRKAASPGNRAQVCQGRGEASEPGRARRGCLEIYLDRGW